MVEEVFQSFMAESEEGHECCGKHKEGGCCHENDEDHECCGDIIMMEITNVVGGHHHDDIMNVVEDIIMMKIMNCCKDN